MHITTGQRRQRGVTLIELLVTMSIVVILLTVGVSGMTNLVKRNTRATEVNSMIGHLNFARAQAILRGTDITVCPISMSALSAGCVADARAWVDGYAVLDADSGEVLRLEEGSPAVTIRSAPVSVKEFRFGDDGILKSNGDLGASLVFCDAKDDSADDAGRSGNVIQPLVVVVSNMGRTRISESMGSGGDPNCKL